MSVVVESVIVDELSEFRTAVGGLDIEWVRKTRGWGPARMTRAGDERVVLSTGGIDFDAVLMCEVPMSKVGFQLMTRAPDGTRWNGSEASSMELRVYGPGAAVFGATPAGARAVTLVADVTAIAQAGEGLGRGALCIPRPGPTVASGPAFHALTEAMVRFAGSPELLDDEAALARFGDDIARSLTPERTYRGAAGVRGYESRDIVARCVEYVRSTGRNQPAMSELCRAAYVSESRLRRAFIDVVEVPPTQFFQLRVLSMLRERLIEAGVGSHEIARVETSLGLTQFGRVAGRYREVFGETPSQTMQRR